MRSNFVPAVLYSISLLAVFGGTVLAEDAHRLTRIGSGMSAEEKASLEDHVASNPDDVEARTKLLGYYFITGRGERDAASAKQQHVVWLIENAPESEVLGLPYGQLDTVRDPEGYVRAKQAWMQAVGESPKNLAVLRNAAKFFLLPDREIAEDLLLKGQKLDADDPEWSKSLGHLYLLGSHSLPRKQQKEAAKKAFQQFGSAYDQMGPTERNWLLPDLAKSALDAGLTDEAKKFAKKMLDDDAGSNRGNRVHHGNLILGRIALLQGDVDEAKSRLLLAGQTEGSPQLASFGPNMRLAKELLEQGETEAVLEYFELCKGFWTSPRRQLERWIEDVKINRIPEFRGNLAY